MSRARRNNLAMPVASHNEAGFANLWRMFSRQWPAPEAEIVFALPRKWRFDFGWQSHKVAVELEGGVRGMGRHQRPAGFQTDLEKYNAAVMLGWAVLRYSAKDLKERPVQVVQEVQRLLAAREERR